ncbi:MAG: hypothetical protein ACLFPD_08205 [Desulfosudaceae bacterium]
MYSKNMTPSLEEIAAHDRFLTRLAQLYDNMDEAYDRLAAQYGFSCAGCQENCCRTRFYNHTWLEFYYLARGLAEQPPAERRRIEKRAADCCREVAAAEAADQTPRVMCPLNDEGWCGLHAHRLMICRLHGIPYEFSPPGRQRVYGEGCAVFSQRHQDQPYLPFDRTPFYMELSALEREFRLAAGIDGKIKLTIAEMILRARPGEAT